MISIIVPVYNEQETVEQVVTRLEESLKNFEKEIVVVDDGSRDRTRIILDALVFQDRITLIRHERNLGKGAAIRSALAVVRGETVVIQDADLEYDTKDLPILLETLLRENCSVVYGSRNLGRAKRVGYSTFLWGGKFLSLVASLLYGQWLTDINTGYKIFRTSLIKSLNLESTGFEFCEEVTAKILKRGIKIKEITIDYWPRKFSEGKKISAADGLIGLLTLLKLRFQRE